MELVRLYNDIHNCHICPNMDPYKELRNASAVTEKTKVFIISQALAEKQLRFSGVNFFQLEGILGSTGRHLEKFLNFFDQTVYPPQEIVLKGGKIIPACKDAYIPVYNTEITQCFPGAVVGKGDRKPETEEIDNCLSKNFIFDEIKYIKPKLLLLMGRLSINTFYKFVLNIKESRSTNNIINDIVNKSTIPKYNINGLTTGVLPIQHASGSNPHYNTMLKNSDLLKLIKGFLNE